MQDHTFLFLISNISNLWGISRSIDITPFVYLICPCYFHLVLLFYFRFVIPYPNIEKKLYAFSLMWNPHTHMCVYKHTYAHKHKTHVHKHICMCIHICLHVYMHTNIHVCIHIHAHTNACVHAHNAYIHTYVHMHTYVYGCTHSVYVCTYMYMCAMHKTYLYMFTHILCKHTESYKIYMDTYTCMKREAVRGKGGRKMRK